MQTTSSPDSGPETAAEAEGEIIRRTAEERLRRSSYLSLRDVSCIARDDVVYLHGRLPSYFLKQVAQELAGGVEGVRRVINRIDVLRQARPRPWGVD